MSGFNSPITGDFDKYFMTTTDLIDRYATGGLWSWGFNVYGQLGDSTLTDRSVPVQTISGGTNWKQVSGGIAYTAAIKTDGTLWVWGYNGWGGLGDSTTTNKSSPVQTISRGTNWKQVSGGWQHTAAIKTDGTLWMWGYNFYCQLGDSTKVTIRSVPQQTISGGTNWKQVSSGYHHTAAIKTDGTLWAWGWNYAGQLGDSTTITARSVPQQTISGGTNWKQVASGAYYTAAIKTDGTLWSWGRNTYGELGDSTLTNRSSPVQTISGGTNWKQVGNIRGYSAAAIKTDGTLWMWGFNQNGQLGDSTTVTIRSVPQQTISGGTNWKQVATGEFFHTAAIKTDGTLWTWGNNDYGQLGDSTLTGRSSPVQTISGGTNWKQVSAGANTTVGVQYSDIGQIL